VGKLEFSLDASDVAAYTWGSCLSRYPLASVDRRTLLEVMSHAAVGRRGWESSAIFRERMSFQHELVHYLQDLATGIGHWDEFTRQASIPGILGGAADVRALAKGPRSVDAAWRAVTAAGRNPKIKAESMAERLRYVPSSSLSSERVAELTQALARHVSIDADPTAYQAFLPEALLEGEAMATVAMTVLDVDLGAAEQEVLVDNVSLWHPDYLSDRYSASWNFFVNLYIEETGGDVTVQKSRFGNVDKWLIMGMTLFTFMIDLACAHPSARLLGEEKLIEYEPGLKFVRLCQALRRLNGHDTLEFYKALLDEEFLRAEELLNSTCDYSYPNTRAVYADWADVFDDEVRLSDDRITALRRDISRARVEDETSFRVKEPSAFLRAGFPFLIQTANGVQSVGGGEYIIIENLEEAYIDIARRLRDLRLAEFFAYGQPFRCPLTREFKMCKAAQEKCANGLSVAADYPTKGCLIRDGVPTYLGLDPLPIPTKHQEGAS